MSRPSSSSVQLKWPVWYLPGAPLGSAVRYVASLSGAFHWVGIYILRSGALELGPFLGAATEHTRIPVGKGVCGTAVAENRNLNIPRVSEFGNYLACSVETRSELVVLIRDRRGKILGQIDIDSHCEDAFGEREQAAVEQVAQELGEWVSQAEFLRALETGKKR
ncbi:MAG: GAF domain-containing protein [Bdellovibrionia bacterium]